MSVFLQAASELEVMVDEATTSPPTCWISIDEETWQVIVPPSPPRAIVFAQADAGPTPPTLAVVYEPAETVPQEVVAGLRSVGWGSQLIPLIRVTRGDGPSDVEVDDVAAAATLMVALVTGGFGDACQGRRVARETTIGSPGHEIIVTWDVALVPEGEVFELEVTLDHVEPVTTRVLAVRGCLSLGDLHAVIQRAMGWDDCHLHEFVIGKQRYGIPDGEPGNDALDEDSVRLEDVLQKRQKLRYEYDFGDGWSHTIKVKAIRPPTDEDPLAVCLSGKGDCPPEDCGGPPGYADMVEARADREHPEHDHWMEWGFEPVPFDRAAVNAQLTELFSSP